MALWWNCVDCLVSTQLLLSVNILLLIWILTPLLFTFNCTFFFFIRCGNVAAILELSETLQRDFTIFEAAPQENRGMPTKKHAADYFL